MKLNAELFEAYLKCPTKCWLRSRGEVAQGNKYAEWVKRENQAYREEGVRLLLRTVPEGERAIAPSGDDIKTAKWRLAVDVTVQGPWTTGSDSVVAKATPENGMTGQPTTAGTEPMPHPDQWFMESVLDAVERVPAVGRGKAAQFIPNRFIYRNKLTKDDRLLLAYDAFVLRQALGRDIAAGKIVHGDDHATLKAKTAPLVNEVQKHTEKIVAVLASPTAPDLVLNRHCGECGYRDQCRRKAIEKDDLSLLAGMSAKERQRLRNKGIFTVTQLSYTFRPRRRAKRLRDKREKYHHSLKALAIREKKIHIVGSPEMKIEGTPVYLDVEGLPDRDFYYLIGLRIGNGDSAVQHSLWADTAEDEGKIWRECLAILETVEKPVLVYYGSYETVFLKRMDERYGRPLESIAILTLRSSSLNLLSFVFAQIYFPIYSNSLKDAAGLLGFSWRVAGFAGVHSIGWRRRWEQSHEAAIKEGLLNYNADDCHALRLVTQTLAAALKQTSSDLPPVGTRIAVAQADDLPSEESMWGRFTSPLAAFEAINKAAQWDYQRDRIYVRTDKRIPSIAAKRKAFVKGSGRLNAKIDCERPRGCPRCGRRFGKPIYTRSKVFFDIRFSRFGIRRWVARYNFSCYWCSACRACAGKPEISWLRTQYGRNLAALVVFRIIELGNSQKSVAQELNRFFGFGMRVPEVHRLKVGAARIYAETRDAILKKMLGGKLIHADETRVVLHRKPAFVWVLTSFQEVVYFFAESREAEFVRKLLDGFQGVLVSDFYTAYDSIPCAQQKCLVHLMRDLNDALVEYPYDEEVREIVTGFGDLLRKIVETIDRRGLKRHFLRKHRVDVGRFYRRVLSRDYRSDTARKCKDRFEKNQGRLFAFLDHDGVPWNNNNAEHAIKAFARLRKDVEGMSTPKGIEEYLVLLSVCQTCKYMGIDFLDFLRSGEKDIHAFAESRRRRRRRRRSSAVTVEALSAGEPVDP